MRSEKLKQIQSADIKLLRVFKAVCDSGSFSAAESVLGISRSAISLHMSDLESRLGLRLCQRGRAGFSITEEGQQVLDHFEVLMAAFEDFRSHVNQINHQLKGELNIGIINNLVTMHTQVITRSLEQLADESRDVHINISMSTLSDIECKVLDGRLHVGAIPFISALPGLQYHDLYQESSYLYCSHGHHLFPNAEDLSIQQLKQCDAILPSDNLSAEAMALHQHLHCNASASDREGSAFLILTGKYIGFLPDHYASKWVQAGKMKKILGDEFHYSTPICLVSKKGMKTNKILSMFFQKISQNLLNS